VAHGADRAVDTLWRGPLVAGSLHSQSWSTEAVMAGSTLARVSLYGGGG
jgi:hypothetical protein